MISYWIVGVLVEDQFPSSTLVAWSGANTREMQPYVLEPMTDGRVRIEPQEGIELLPWDYKSRKNAKEALKRLLQRGQGFLPLRNVRNLRCMAVVSNETRHTHESGKWYSLDSPFRAATKHMILPHGSGEL